VNEYISLTQLGRIYGVTARDVGGWLKGLGLRDATGWPSRDAVKQGLVQERVSQYGSQWFWHQDGTSVVLDGMCYPRSGAGVEQHEGFVLIRGS
jgi:hypothetical protein